MVLNIREHGSTIIKWFIKIKKDIIERFIAIVDDIYKRRQIKKIAIRKSR